MKKDIRRILRNFNNGMIEHSMSRFRREVYCYKCQKHEWVCKCRDKGIRLFKLKTELLMARFNITLGSCSPEDRKLVDRLEPRYI